MVLFTECDSCGSKRIARMSADTGDGWVFDYEQHPDGNISIDGYFPHFEEFTKGKGSFVDVDFHLCMECGKFQGKFPITDERIKETFFGSQL